MVEVQRNFPEMEPPRNAKLLVSRLFLEQKGLPPILNGLPDDVRDELITGRVLELIPREPTPEHFAVLIQMTQDPCLDIPVREALRSLAYDPTYAYAGMARSALSEREGSAKRVIARTVIPSAVHHARQQVIGTTMEKPFIS